MQNILIKNTKSLTRALKIENKNNLEIAKPNPFGDFIPRENCFKYLKEIYNLDSLNETEIEQELLKNNIKLIPVTAVYSIVSSKEEEGTCTIESYNTLSEALEVFERAKLTQMIESNADTYFLENAETIFIDMEFLNEKTGVFEGFSPQIVEEYCFKIKKETSEDIAKIIDCDKKEEVI